ncbi:unnamed protein product, partial [Scytosiphon promiscuus]
MAATTAIAFSHNPSYTETLRAQEEKEEEEEEDDIPQLRKSCDYCVRMKRGCNGGSPCELCSRRNGPSKSGADQQRARSIARESPARIPRSLLRPPLLAPPPPRGAAQLPPPRPAPLPEGPRTPRPAAAAARRPRPR